MYLSALITLIVKLYNNFVTVLDHLKENEKLHEIHIGLQRNEVEEQIKKHIDE